MDIFSSTITFVIALTTAWLLARPFWTIASETSLPLEAEAGESGNRQRLMFGIEELEADFHSGKLTEEEFQTLRRELINEAARGELRLRE